MCNFDGARLSPRSFSARGAIICRSVAANSLLLHPEHGTAGECPARAQACPPGHIPPRGFRRAGSRRSIRSSSLFAAQSWTDTPRSETRWERPAIWRRPEKEPLAVAAQPRAPSLFTDPTVCRELIRRPSAPKPLRGPTLNIQTCSTRTH